MIVHFCFIDLETGKKVYKNYQTKSLDIRLIDCCRSLYPCEGDYVFYHYYSNGYEMSPGGCFPYILSKGKYKWRVPCEDVTLREFLDTHNITENDILYVEAGEGGGGGELNLVWLLKWLVSVYQIFEEWAGRISLYADIIIFGSAVIKYFKARIPAPQDVIEMITRRDHWIIYELEDVLGIYDRNFCETLLLMSGYKHNENDEIYYRQGGEKHFTEDEYYDADSTIWGRKSKGWFKQVDEGICELNKLANAIHLYYMDNNSELYDSYLSKIRQFVEENNKLLELGSGLQIVQRKKHLLSGRKTIKKLEEEINVLVDYSEDEYYRAVDEYDKSHK